MQRRSSRSLGALLPPRDVSRGKPKLLSSAVSPGNNKVVEASFEVGFLGDPKGLLSGLLWLCSGQEMLSTVRVVSWVTMAWNIFACADYRCQHGHVDRLL